MESLQQFTLYQHAEIIDLLNVLEKSKLIKERQEVESLVKCLDNMENQFGQVLQELQQVRCQLEQIQDKGIKALATRIVSRVGNKVRQIGSQIVAFKRYIVASAKNAITKMKEKGIGALQRAVQAMKIPTALRHIKEGLHSCMEEMNKGAEKIGLIGDELHKAAVHSKNAGRILFKKPQRENTPRDVEKGALAKIQKVLISCGKVFANMEKSTERTLQRVEHFCKGTEKSSVKAEIEKLKEGKKNLPAVLPKEVGKER